MKAEMSTYELENRESSLQTEEARKRFLVNVSSNASFILTQTVVTLWLTSFLVRHLGIAAFGMIPLVVSLTTYMSVLTTALNNAVSRFLAIDLGEGDKVAANKTFNTALLGTAGIVLILSPPVLFMSWAFPHLFNVPGGWGKDASWLFAIVAIGFFVTVIGSTFGVSPFVHSQFLLRNIANFAGLLARVGLIIILYSFFRARLWYAGGATLFGASVSLVGYLILWRKLTPELCIQVKAFDRSKLQSLMGMGGWVAVNMVGAMLLARTDLIVVNIFFGAAMTGGYGAVAQFSALMEYLVSAAGTVVWPIILIKFAQGDVAGLKRLTSQAIKLLGLALALPVGLLCGFSRPLLTIWLGPSFESLSTILIIIVCHQSLNLSVRPLLYVQNAYNKVRWPAIATLLCGGANLCLAILFAKWGVWGAAGVALAGALVWTGKNAFYMPIYTARIIGLPWWTYFPSLGTSVIGTVFVGVASYGLTLVRMPYSWSTMAGAAALVSLAYVAVVWAIGLSGADKQLLRNLSPLQATQS